MREVEISWGHLSHPSTCGWVACQTLAADWVRIEICQKWFNLLTFCTFTGNPIECLPYWVQESLWCRVQKEPSDKNVSVRSWGSPQPCCVTHGLPSAVCQHNMKLCIPGLGVLASAQKAVTANENITCNSWPNYDFKLSQELVIQRGREAQHEHRAKRILLPKIIQN